MVIDQFSKWVECFPIGNQTAATIARTIVDQVIVRLGCPLEIHTDQGANFESELFHSVCHLLHVAKTRTTAYRPSSNGQIERCNRTLVQMIRCFLLEKDHDWDQYVPQLAGAMRATTNRTTGFTANLMMLGREVVLPADVVFPIPGLKQQEPASYVQQLLQRLHEVHHVARRAIKGAQAYQKKHYDRSLLKCVYETGDLVYVFNSPALRPGEGSKLRPVWVGPSLIVEVLSPVLFRVRGIKREWVVHHDRMKPFRDNTIPA